MNAEFQSIFARLKTILQKQASHLSVKEDGATCYGLHAPAGPAAVRAWRGEMRQRMLPVAWVQMGKAYVSFHLMSIYGSRELLDGMSKELRAHRQGKTCFNFKTFDEKVFKELEQLTLRSLSAFKKAGFVTDETASRGKGPARRAAK